MQFWKNKGMTWQTDAFSDDAWKCRVSQTQWRWMTKCSSSRHATQRRRTRGHELSYDTKMVWQRADVDEDRSLFLLSTSATWRSSLATYGRPCRHRKTRTESLNSIHSGTRSQWRSQSSGNGCSELGRQWVFNGFDLNTGNFLNRNPSQTRRHCAYTSHPHSKQTLFCYVHHSITRLSITVSTSSTWRLVSTRKQPTLTRPIQSDVPTSAVVRRWVHMAKKAAWRGRHVCFFGLLSPSPSRNPEIHNKQTEMRLLMSIMWRVIVN